MKISRLAAFVGAIGIVGTLSSPSYAYIDPGTGSIILQGLIGGLAAAMAFLYSFREKLSNLLSRKPKLPERESPGE